MNVVFLEMLDFKIKMSLGGDEDNDVTSFKD